MAVSIEELIRDAVRSEIRRTVEELRPAIADAVQGAAAKVGPSHAPPHYVSAREAARIMGAHPATVRKLVTEGKLGRYSLEGQLRVKVSDVHAYLAREGPASPTINLDERALELLRDKHD